MRIQRKGDEFISENIDFDVGVEGHLLETASGYTGRGSWKSDAALELQTLTMDVSEITKGWWGGRGWGALETRFKGSKNGRKQ